MWLYLYMKLARHLDPLPFSIHAVVTAVVWPASEPASEPASQPESQPAIELQI
jgi:hypothetical protein